jgi:hypothetical protein
LIGKRREKSFGRVESPAAQKPVPEWEELVHTPVVFVRMANKGLAGYGEWKSA